MDNIMRLPALPAAALLSLTLLSACATAPSPAEICSAEWVSARSAKAMKQFKRDTRPIFRKLRKTGDALKDGRQPGPLQMFSLMNSLSKLGRKFENGRAMKDMRTLANTCDDPELIKNAMTDFMREQGIDEKFIGFINSLEAYRTMLETGKRPDIKI